ncbi:triphosphoribosyl-dephospho-CoA synthase MdcB [Legionella genomosp. 1]|uniref:triphosphoribosyl-dephospho-CoA synthase MdcB n=1 Tax=Legionella genomosp. 1 TaxID=1093625 RepID=UPI001054AEC3|nr:triphosphoribosyl-dephospho-CoA synthase MdcB [Legionella genomosp. 1]
MPHFHHSLTSISQIARYFAKMAVRALYDEVALYPKPGLVSFVDSGAHSDMDGSLFFRSLFGLRHYFVHLGCHAAEDLAPRNLVPLGIKAEKTMQSITGGINTHRGAIFSMGILCATICNLSRRFRQFSLWDLQSAIIEQWAEYLQKEHTNLNTHGVVVRQKYAVNDARQIAIDGYALVFDAYAELFPIQGDSLFFGLLAYQHFLLNLDDINVLYRTGPEGLAFARGHIRQSISANNREQSIRAADDLHRLFSKANISPGGVADMLGLLFFLRQIFGRQS